MLICFLSGKDSIVEWRLCQAGHMPFRPLVEDGESLFPGYIFVPWFDRWPTLHAVRGVVRVLGLAPSGFVDDLRSNMVGGAVRLDRKDELPLAAGQFVRITAGPHCGLIGVVKGKRRRGRLSIKLDYFGSERLVSIPIHLLASPMAVSAAR